MNLFQSREKKWGARYYLRETAYLYDLCHSIEFYCAREVIKKKCYRNCVVMNVGISATI